MISHNDVDNADGHLTDANATTKVKPTPKSQNDSILLYLAIKPMVEFASTTSPIPRECSSN